ncbi:MAG: type II 3-dehydroquinate dehydratase [Negativicutes bacterium]|nr:type II 3-dehydroquinate dehydratase [Negativicutes bacterium]
MHILIINGPNLNLLGRREPEIYGRQTYADLLAYIRNVCLENQVSVEFYQSNHEGDLIDAIQHAEGCCDGIVINPGAYTHTSIAILDALKAVDLPAVEVHLTQLSQREAFRQVSYAGMACAASFQGLGFAGYREAIVWLLKNGGGKSSGW